MYTIQPKKMVLMNILDILKKYSDAEHTLTQQDIVKILKEEYNMTVDRKTVKSNLMNLLDIEDGLFYTEIERTDKNGNDVSLCTDWYLEREFDDSELRLLIDSLLFSKHIPYSQCKNLIEKLKGLSNVYFDKKVKHICNLPENQPQNKELFHTIDVLDDAISKNKKVSFTYNNYGLDKKLHPKRDWKYVVNPYQMVATNGRYYLICNYDIYGELSNYRIDRITDIQMLDEKAKPIKEASKDGLNLPKHMAEHIYMFAGESAEVKFRAKNYIVDQVIDWYGKDIKIETETDEECIITVKVNRQAFFFWALQYGLHIEVLEPGDLREEIKNAIKQMSDKYFQE